MSFDTTSGQLPPCEDCLYQHAARANYQAALWRHTLQASPIIPSPVRQGWSMEDGQLAVMWQNGPHAPEVVIEFLACKCKKSCIFPACQNMADDDDDAELEYSIDHGDGLEEITDIDDD